MKKAFTLLEMLLVIVIISVAALIIVPVVTNNINSSKNNVYNNLINKILVSSTDWAVENTDKLPKENETINITLGTLQSNGYISTSLLNPKTDNLFPSDMIIKISYIKSNKNNPKLKYGKYDGNYAFQVDVNSGHEIKDITSDYTIIELGLSDSEVDNIVYKDKEGNDISLKEYNIQYVTNNVNVEKINTSKTGIYYVYYSDNNGNKNFNRVFNVTDTEIPEIIFPDDDIVSTSVSSFDLYNNVTCNDNSGSCNLKIIEGEDEFYTALQNKETGNYVVRYEGTDPTGNKVTKNRVIEIQ